MCIYIIYIYIYKYMYNTSIHLYKHKYIDIFKYYRYPIANRKLSNGPLVHCPDRLCRDFRRNAQAVQQLIDRMEGLEGAAWLWQTW